MARKFAAICENETATRGRVATLLSRLHWRTESVTQTSRANGEAQPDLWIADLTVRGIEPSVVISRVPIVDGNAPLLIVTECRFVWPFGDALDALRERWFGPVDLLFSPFESDELELRVRWLTDVEQREPAPAKEKAPMTHRLGPLSVDTGKWTVRLRNVPLPVEQPQLLILAELIQARGDVVPGSVLIEAMGHDPSAYCESAIRSHVSRLKDALEEAGADRRCIRNLYGRGYALDEALLACRGDVIPKPHRR